ncbi:MAG TPA: glycosyltransferase family 4 protein [Candidatus Acidoferrum sp.]|nr:glycosyltransferase family 4 protein [Candidatus Acidoferrum sp.]
MSSQSALMLVSARADAELRQQVADGVRPRPEYLLLESLHGVDLLDWSKIPGHVRTRSRWRSSLHVAAALRHLPGYGVVFSDGEHVGIPLALAMRGLGLTTPHLVIGHHLTSRAKVPLLRNLRAHERMNRILVHSRLQEELARGRLGIPDAKLAFVPYYADQEFWRPMGAAEERLVVSAGSEHRDYATMAAACGDLDARVYIAAGSVHSPSSTFSNPARWPPNFESGFASYAALRELYSRASVVVVPVVETDFQAGVTTVLEAMACGKAVVTSATRGQAGVVRHGITGICVPPGDSDELKRVVQRLLSSPGERARLGRAAREAIVDEYGVELYARRLAGHLSELAAQALVAA